MKELRSPLRIDVEENEQRGYAASVEWKPKNKKNYLFAVGRGSTKLSALRDASGAFIEGLRWDPSRRQ